MAVSSPWLDRYAFLVYLETAPCLPVVQTEGSRYHDLMEFEPSQTPNILAPLLVENALSDIPLFGPEKADIDALVKSALNTPVREGSLVVDEASREMPPLDLEESSSVAEKLQALGVYSDTHLTRKENARSPETKKQQKGQTNEEPLSPQERHERFLNDRMNSLGLPSKGHEILDHIMLLRAREMYLFNCATNHKIVSDDQCLQDVWAWVAGSSSQLPLRLNNSACFILAHNLAGAEKAANEGGMTLRPLDMSYLGVYGIWTHDLGW